MGNDYESMCLFTEEWSQLASRLLHKEAPQGQGFFLFARSVVGV